MFRPRASSDSQPSVDKTAYADPGLRRSLKLSIGIGAILLWLILAYLAVRDAASERAKAVQELRTNAELQSHAKAQELTAFFRELFVATRTISLLPAIRHAKPKNRPSAEDDVVDGVRFQRTDAETVQQLYNQAASMASVSEIYVVYDGFNPDRGEVPFLMFDNIIVDRIHSARLTKNYSGVPRDPADIPKEDESAEYAYLKTLLKIFHTQYPTLPSTAPNGIDRDISPLMVTCDNTQYQSILHGNPHDRLGFLLSVPVYGDSDGRFKGLISTIVRANALEAKLLGWPLIPVTDMERRQATLEGDKLNTPPSEYVLENKATGARIYDRRNALIPQFLNGLAHPAIELSNAVGAVDEEQWTLHQFIPQATIGALDAEIRDKQNLRLLGNTLLIIVLCFVLWLFLQRRVMDDLEHLANHDSLTGLPNRRELTKRISEALNVASLNQNRLAVMMVDLDNFKQINDSAGHAAGDQLLGEVARRFQKTLRSTDLVKRLAPSARISDPKAIVGRLGGDEFLVLLPNVGGVEQAQMVAERLIAVLAKPVVLDGQSTYCHASIGIAIFPAHGNNADLLMRRADSAMYIAKRVRGSSIALFDRKICEASVRHMRLLSDLHVAMMEQQFVLHYQPIFDISGMRISAAEALLRWQHPKYGLVPPNEFIPLLEQTGLIVDAGAWALRKACQQLAHWKQSVSPIEHIAINVSVVQLSQSDFVSDAIAIVNEEGVMPESITFEITESVLMEITQKHLHLLQNLRDAGMQVALDDFGTGYSSLRYLRQLPVSILKIDRSMVVDCDHPAGRAILFVLCDLARRMGIRCVAEGVETAAQLHTMVEAGCHSIQGSIVAKPAPAEQADIVARTFDSAALFMRESQPSTPDHTQIALPLSRSRTV